MAKKHTKRHSASLSTREMQIKTTVKYCLTLVRMVIIKKSKKSKCCGERVEKREPSYTAGGNVNWHNRYGLQYGNFLKKLKIELLYDPAGLLLGIHPEKTII